MKWFEEKILRFQTLRVFKFCLGPVLYPLPPYFTPPLFLKCRSLIAAQQLRLLAKELTNDASTGLFNFIKLNFQRKMKRKKWKKMRKLDRPIFSDLVLRLAKEFEECVSLFFLLFYYFDIFKVQLAFFNFSLKDLLKQVINKLTISVIETEKMRGKEISE